MASKVEALAFPRTLSISRRVSRFTPSLSLQAGLTLTKAIDSSSSLTRHFSLLAFAWVYWNFDAAFSESAVAPHPLDIDPPSDRVGQSLIGHAFLSTTAPSMCE